MLERVSVRNPQGQTIMLTLKETSEGILVRSIDGLGPVKTTVSSSTMAQLPGSQYQANRRESRNIVMTLGLDSRYGGGSVTDIRRRIDQFFMPGMMLYMQYYMSNGLTVGISGLVESNEPVIFSKDPQVVISILCFNPDFRDTELVVQGFEARTTTTWNDIDYGGTVSSGFDIEFSINGSEASDGFVLQHYSSESNEYKILRFWANLEPLDRVIISTYPGSKRASVVRGGSSFSILYGVTPESDWFQLEPHVTNRLSARIIGPTSTYYEVSFRNRYGSI